MAVENIPQEWNADIKGVENKLNQLFDKKWMDNCWDAFVEYFNENKNG